MLCPGRTPDHVARLDLLDSAFPFPVRPTPAVTSRCCPFGEYAMQTWRRGSKVTYAPEKAAESFAGNRRVDTHIPVKILGAGPLTEGWRAGP